MMHLAVGSRLQQRLSPIAVPLQMAGFLSVLIFLIGCVFEVLVINDLYSAQHFLLSSLMVALALWAIVEVYLIRRQFNTAVSLRMLKIALWLQLLLALVRGFADLRVAHHEGGSHGLISGPDFGLALVFVPLDLSLFVLISRLIIHSFAYAEFLRANQLAQQMEALEEARSALQQSEERYRLIANWVDDVIWTLDDRGHFNYISPSIGKLAGYSPSELLQQPLSAILREDSARRLADVSRAVLGQVELGCPIEPIRVELEQFRRDGSSFWCEVTMNGLYGSDHRFIGFVGVTRDISERKGYESDLREARDAAEAANRALLSANTLLQGQATTDALSGVFNRRHFEEALEGQIAKARSDGKPICLLIIDIDRFKVINDRFGHQIGDLVIVQLAALLKEGLRKVDVLLARWGGDEFVVLLPRTPAKEAWELAERLRQMIAEHGFPVALQVTGSFGVAELQPEESAEDWFARVDSVLYAAKAAGRNQVSLST
jgi:diguanylate cyclase (GGDEF)-like protein/PAS domain S-box-containing protein